LQDKLRVLPGGGDGILDFFVSGASADIPGNGLFDFLFFRVFIAVEKGLCCKDHPGRTKPALNGAFFHEGFLNGMKLGPVSQAFNRYNGQPLDIDGKGNAGTDRPVVNQNGAGTTRAKAASFPRSHKFKVVP